MMKQRHNPPSNEDNFDSLCMQLMGKLWDAPGVTKHGRRGHAQHGVDFFGTGPRGVCGGQSKLREEGNALTKRDVLKEIDKAKAFKPKLDVYVILTSTKRNPALQRVVAEKNVEHSDAGLFSVEIKFWDDIEELLETYTEVRDSIFGGLPAEATARIEHRLDAIKEGIQHLTTATVHEPGDFHEDIEAAVKHTQEGQPNEALSILRLLREQKWGSLNDRHKYRVLGNIGHALAAKEDYQEAANYFIEAKSFQPKDIKARCLEALGQYNLMQKELAFKLIEGVRHDDPDLPLAAAIWVQSAPESMPFSKVEAQMPGKLRDDGDVAISLAIRARQAEELDKAEHYARAAVADAPKAWRFREELAAILLERELRRDRYRFGPGPKPDNPERFEEIESLLCEAIRTAPSAISPKSRARMHVNSALALQFLGRGNEAAHETELAAAACPQDAEVSLRHAFLLYEQGQKGRAIDELSATEQREPTLLVILTLAQLLAERNEEEDREEAVTILETHLTKLEGAPRHVQTEYIQVLIDLHCEAGRTEHAKQILDGLDGSLLPDTGRAILDAVILRDSGDRAGAIERVRGMVAEVEAHGHWTDQRRLAILCQSLALYEEGLSLWKHVVTPETAGPDVHRVLACAYHAADDPFILDFCRRLRENDVYDAQYLDLEVAKLEEYNQTDDAVSAIQEFLARKPSDDRAPAFRVRLSLIGIRRGRPELIVKDPTLLPQADLVDPKLGLMVVEVLRYGAGPDEAVGYAYDLYRAKPSTLEAHLAVIASLGTAYGPKPILVHPVKVEPGAAVFYQQAGTETQEWIIIEDFPHPRLELREYPPDHSVALAMMGKHCGETFVLRAHPFQDLTATIKQIQSKFVRRWEDCIHHLEERFPEQGAISRFSLAKNEKGDLDFTPIFRSLDQKHETVQKTLDAYKNEPLTLHLLGRSAGRNVFDALRFLAGMPDVRVLTCRGTQEEFSQAIADLNTCNGLVLDESALSTLFIMRIEDILRGLPIPLIVSEGTLQAIGDVEALHADPDQAEDILLKSGDHYQHVVISAEMRAEESRRLEGFLQIIEEVCRVEGGAALASLDKDMRDKLVAVAGRPAAESMQLAASTGRVLWTDDLRMGDLARGVSKAARVWTQSLLIWAADRGHCPPDQLAASALQLLGTGYFWTRIWPDVVALAAVKSQWDPRQKPLADAVRHFGDPHVEIASVMHLAGRSFLEILRRAPSGKAAYLMSCILDQLGMRDGGLCAEIILHAARSFENRPDPDQIAEKVEVVVTTWFENRRMSGIPVH